MITSWRGCGLLTGEMVVRLGSAQQFSRDSDGCMLDWVSSQERAVLRPGPTWREAVDTAESPQSTSARASACTHAAHCRTGPLEPGTTTFGLLRLLVRSAWMQGMRDHRSAADMSSFARSTPAPVRAASWRPDPASIRSTGCRASPP